MAIVINFAGASLRRPGAYSRLRVAQGAAADAQLGVVALVGEAEEGDAFSVESGPSAYTFTPDQFGEIVNKFGSGELVNAAKLALGPGNDEQIAGGAQQLLLLKTNASTKAQLVLATSYGTLKAKKSGAPGNMISVEITTPSSGFRAITIEDALSGVSEVSGSIGSQGVFTLECTDGVSTVATLTINATTISTAITGGTASPLSLPKAQFATIQQLVDYINTKTNYAATVVDSSQKNQPLSVLDTVSAVDILAGPYTALRDLQDIKDFFADSGLVDFTATATKGLPDNVSKNFLAGGAKGASSNAAITAAYDALMKSRVNFVVPLFSRDATADITAGSTDASSTYTIDSIHVGARTHVSQTASVKGKKERQAFLAFRGSFDNAKVKSFNLANGRCALMFQNVDVADANGDIVTSSPHMLAVINAGMRAAAVVGLPLTFKKANVNGFSMDANDFDPEVDGDEAIDANLTFLEKAPGGGFRFVIDNSTYGQVKDAWIWARPGVIYAADTACFAIRLNVETFIGQRNSDVTPETVKNLLISVMDGLRTSGIIVPDAASGGKGYTALSVNFKGNIINTSVTLVLVEGFEFALNDITVTRAAS